MLVHSYYPADIRVRREAEALVGAGFRVDVVSLRAPKKSGHSSEPSRDRLNGVEIHRLPIARKRKSAVRYLFEYLSLIVLGAWKLTAIHLKNPFQAVHIHNMPDALVLAGIIPKWMGAKLILDVHDPMTELYSSTRDPGRNSVFLKVIRWQEQWSLRLAHWIITVNESMRKNIQDKGILSHRIIVVHNFSDTQYLPVKEDIACWTRHKDCMVWLYAGTINKQYRLDIAIRALKIALHFFPSIRFRLLGGGNDLERILRLAEDLGVREYIEPLEGVNIDQLKDFMSDVDIGISCNQGGSFGDLQFSVKVIDYLSQGLPVVASRTRTLERYIPEDTIFYFEPENADDMAEQIIFLWNNPDIVKQKMENAKKLFPQFTWQHEKSKLISFYRGILQ